MNKELHLCGMLQRRVPRHVPSSLRRPPPPLRRPIGGCRQVMVSWFRGPAGLVLRNVEFPPVFESEVLVRVRAVSINTIDLTEASAIPYIAMTAWAALLGFAKMSAGQRVLIVGGDDVIGYSAIQLAVAHRCHIVTTCCGENIALALAADANQAVDCLSEDIQLAVKGKFDVFDTIGAARTEKIGLGLVKRGGRYVNLEENLPVDQPDSLVYPVRVNSELIADLYVNHGIEYCTISEPSFPDSLEEISKLVGAERMRIPIAKTFLITQVREAFEAADNLRTLGKMVLTLD